MSIPRYLLGVLITMAALVILAALSSAPFYLQAAFVCGGGVYLVLCSIPYWKFWRKGR